MNLLGIGKILKISIILSKLNKSTLKGKGGFIEVIEVFEQKREE